MAELKEVIVPDIGGATDVEIIEIAVKPGDKVQPEDTLITLESDKASMDVPAPFEGTVKELKVNLGDKISEGSVILLMQAAKSESLKSTPESKASKPKVATAATEQNILVPDIGTDEAVEVIEVSISEGDEVNIDDPIITLESEKASMDVPAPMAGKIKAIKIKVGDKVKQGDLIALIESVATAPAESVKASTDTSEKQPVQMSADVSTPVITSNNANTHAGPAVRRLANQLGVDLKSITGSGRKSRVLLDDVHAFVKRAMQGGASTGAGFSVAAARKVDFSKFGETDIQPLSRIEKLSGANLHRNWVTVPHVTQFDEADITDLEAFRKANKARVEKQGAKLTPLVFIMKAVVSALKAHPKFNSSLDESGESLVMKKYFHVGVAVDTPNGLVVPVIRDVDQKGFIELAVELGEISLRARDGKLKSNKMQGGCFSISSLGGIGGTAFTPIVNSPEVAILGVSRSAIKPQFIENEFMPRLMLPLCLSYDHRVIDGADAARFITHLSRCLADLRQILV